METETSAWKNLCCETPPIPPSDLLDLSYQWLQVFGEWSST